MPAPHTISKTNELPNLQALCDLSDFQDHFNAEDINKLVSKAPDPETVVRSITEKLDGQSQALQRKWRQTLTAMWATHNPRIPLLRELPVSAEEVSHAPVLEDAIALLRALEEQPANLSEEQSEQLIESHDAMRLAKALPSMENVDILAVESEWSVLPLKRLRATLQAARLIRPYQGQLVVIQSRYKRFLSFPAVQQFYVLWHAENYHSDWSDFAGQWSQFVQVIQDYLPLLWDLNQITSGDTEDEHEWCMQTMEAFTPLWAQEGLLNHGREHPNLLSLFHQCSLPAVINKAIICDILSRYGLIVFPDEDHNPCTPTKSSLDVKFTWTDLGAKIIKAERSTELPCGLSLLE